MSSNTLKILWQNLRSQILLHSIPDKWSNESCIFCSNPSALLCSVDLSPSAYFYGKYNSCGIFTSERFSSKKRLWNTDFSKLTEGLLILGVQTVTLSWISGQENCLDSTSISIAWISKVCFMLSRPEISGVILVKWNLRHYKVPTIR